MIGCHVFIFAKFGNPGLAGKNRDPVRCVLWNQQAVEDRESGSTSEPAVDLRESMAEHCGKYRACVEVFMKFIFSCMPVDNRHQNNEYLRLQ